MRVPKGTIIHPTYDAFEQSLNDLMVNTGIAPFNNSRSIVPVINNNGISKGELKEVFSSEVSRLNKAIMNQPKNDTYINENGIVTYFVRANTKRQNLNARVRGRGNRV